jgi:NADH-quinone oxidoreductase subunit L
MAELIWWAIWFPLIGVLINGLLISGMSASVKRKYSGWIASAASGLAFVVALVIFANLTSILGGQQYRDVEAGSWIESGSLNIPYGLRIDALSVTMMLVVTGVGTLIHIFSIGYMAHDERVSRYFTYLNLFMVAMLILVLANNFVLMFVGWEGVGLCSYLLIGFWFERPSAAQAAKKAFIVNRVGDFGFLLAMFALYRLTESLVFNRPDGGGALDHAAALTHLKVWGLPAVTVICLLFFLGATGKSAQLPLYMWLPDAMEGPTPVSALIHAATMVTAGVYLVARCAPLFSLSPIAQSVVAWVGILTAFYAALIAIKQYDIKRVLAYSTVSQLGYMFVGVGVGAYAAGIAHLVTHAFFKALLFLGAGAVMHALDGQLDLRKMGNLRRYLRVTYLTCGVGWLAICGIPPFAGFFSKDLILESAYEHGHLWIMWLGVITAGMTAFYMTRMFVTVFRGSERIEMGDEGHGGDGQEHGPSHAHTHTRGHAREHGHGHDQGHGHGHKRVHVHPEQPVMNIPLIILALGALAGGAVIFFLPQFLAPVTTDMARHAAETAQAAPGAAAGAHGAAEAAHGAAGGAHGAASHPWTPFTLPGIAALAAALIGLSAAWANTEKLQQGWSAGAERSFGLLQRIYEGFLHAVFVTAGAWLAQILFNVVDRLMIDKAVDLAGVFVNYLAESLRTLQTGYVRNYALVMLAGAVFVVACFMIILQVQISLPLFFGIAVGVILLGLVYSWIAQRVTGGRTPEVVSTAEGPQP